MKISRTSRSGRGRQQDVVVTVSPAWIMGANPLPVVLFQLKTLVEAQSGQMTPDEAEDLAARLRYAAKEARKLVGAR